MVVPMEAETQSEQKGKEVGLRLSKDAWFTSLALWHFPSHGPIGAQPFHWIFFLFKCSRAWWKSGRRWIFHARTYAPSLTESQEKSSMGYLCNNLRVQKWKSDTKWLHLRLQHLSLSLPLLNSPVYNRGQTWITWSLFGEASNHTNNKTVAGVEWYCKMAANWEQDICNIYFLLHYCTLQYACKVFTSITIKNQAKYNSPFVPPAVAPDRHIRPNAPLPLRWKRPVSEGPREWGGQRLSKTRRKGRRWKAARGKKRGHAFVGLGPADHRGAPAAKPLRQWLPVCTVSS